VVNGWRDAERAAYRLRALNLLTNWFMTQPRQLRPTTVPTSGAPSARADRLARRTPPRTSPSSIRRLALDELFIGAQDRAGRVSRTQLGKFDGRVGGWWRR
jgi:hypothetical protein